MKRAARVPILTWHGMGLSGNDYATNDHVALARDLEAIHAAGLRIVSLRRIADELIAGRLDRLEGCIGLSIDDGSDFDFHDVPHQVWGPQRGMMRILADFRARHGPDEQPELNVTSFTIVSPGARESLDRSCMTGCGWWNDDWWRAAEASGLMAIENHSWDHNHPALDATATSAARGGFGIDDYAEAEAEIAAPVQYLRDRRGRGDEVLFAYPYADANAFLSETWLPSEGRKHGIHAAFAGGSTPVVAGSSRWRIPRYMFGHDWKSEEDLQALLRDAGALPRARPHISRLLTRVRKALYAMKPPPPPPRSWHDCLRTWEVPDARAVAGELFRRNFGHDAPEYRRHFVLVYSPPSDSEDTTPSVVAYFHHLPFEEMYLGGGMCVDAGAYRRMPKWLFEQVRAEGGLATIVGKQSIAMLGDSPACFGHVGEPRARAADLRTGFVDTGVEHLMVVWRRELRDDEKQRLIDRVVAHGAF